MNSSMTSSVLMIVAMFALMYFLMIRPEKKRKQQAENMRNALKKGDSIVTIGGIMGKEAEVLERQVAFVRCNGGTNAKKRYEYIGIQDCLSATKVAAGPLECQFGCLGFGSCTKACKYGAIKVVNGVAQVDEDLCVGCMACAAACPTDDHISRCHNGRHIVDILPHVNTAVFQVNTLFLHLFRHPSLP